MSGSNKTHNLLWPVFLIASVPFNYYKDDFILTAQVYELQQTLVVWSLALDRTEASAKGVM